MKVCLSGALISQAYRFCNWHCYLSLLWVPPTRILGWPVFLCPFSSFPGTGCQRKLSCLLGGHSQKPIFHVFLVAEIRKVFTLLFSHSFAVQQNSQKSPGSVLQNGQHCPIPSAFPCLDIEPSCWHVVEWLAIFLGL